MNLNPLQSVPVPTKPENTLERVQQLLGERAELAARVAQLDMEIGILTAHLVATASRPEPRPGHQMAYRISAAAKLMDVSEDVLRREITAGQLNSYLIGGARVVLAGELEEYLRTRPQRREGE